MDRDMIVSPHVQQQLIAAKVWAVSVVTVIIFALVGVGIWTQWDKMPLVGLAILVALGIVLLCGVLAAIVALIRFTCQPRYTDVGEWGGYHTGLFGKVSAAPPMAAVPVKQIATKKKTEITPILPGIVEMIEQGTIAAGMTQMVIGYTLKGQLIMAGWPGTFAVAGLGRSGKTRRVIMIVIQALIGGARVTICDPHYEKPDSLGKQLIALHPWLYCLAKDNEEIVTASREFLAEMYARRGKTSGEWNGETRGTPRIIIFDEWPYLMETKSIADEDREVLIEVAEDCSSQYAGFDGFAGLIGQKWTQDSVGSTDIRRSLHLVFIHRLNAEFAAFFLARAKWKNRAAEMPKMHCIFDNDGEIMEVVTPNIPDDSAERAAELLATLRNPEKQYQLAAPAVKGSLSQGSQNFELSPDFYNERTETLKQLPEPRESVESLMKAPEENEIKGETFTMRPAPDTPPAGYTPAVETRIALVCMQLAKDGQKVTREAVKAHLGWHNGHHPLIKYFFDHQNQQN